MSDPREILDQLLRKSVLSAPGLAGAVDIVPIPMHGDRMVRLRTLEEALEDFSTDSGAVSYLIQVKARAPAPGASPTPPPAPGTGPRRAGGAAAPSQAPTASEPAWHAAIGGEPIYDAGGKLNIPYLARNAELLLDSGEYALARNIFRTIASSGERKGLALFGIGRCDEAEGRLQEARAHYEESIAYHARLETYRRLIAVLQSLKKEGLAAEACERAASIKDLDAQDAKARFELHKTAGNCWTRAGAPAQAEKQFQRALELEPAADDIRANLGALFLVAKDTAKAQRHFEDALASNPDNAAALAGMGACCLAVGDKRRAHDWLARALERKLDNPTALYQLVKCAYDLKTYATAARLAEAYVEVGPVNVNLMYSLAGLQFHLGRMKDARATALQALGLNAEHRGARELLKLIERS